MSLVDGVGRSIDYLRLSVTDRCDLRCVYCMAKNMTFLPRQQVLTLEELQRLATVFVSQGVRKIRLTGGRTADPSRHCRTVPPYRRVARPA